MKKGFFIVFEGIDGSGKTTQAGLLAGVLAGKGHRVLVTREPGGTGMGEQLREILLNSEGYIDTVAEALIYTAARAQHVAEKILPAVREGMVVIADRFADSTRAYQGYGKGLDMEFLDLLNKHACMGLFPDITILLDIDPGRALSRLDRPADRMEREGREFLQRVRKGFLDLAGREPDRYLILDAAAPAEKIHIRAVEIVEKRMAAEPGVPG